MIRPDPNLPPREQEPLIVLALTILGEARNQPYAGKVAVGQVIANRMRAKGKTAAEIAFAPWQFSCWNPSDPNKQFLMEVIAKQAGNVKPLGVWEECLQAAETALQEPCDESHMATHYTTLDLWGCDDAKRRKPRWHSLQAIADGVTTELFRLAEHVFGTTKW